MLNAISIKIPIIFFTNIENSSLQFIWKQKRPQIANAILSRKSNAEGITILDFSLYYRVTVTKTTWHKSRHEDKWSRTEDPDTNPHKYSHLGGRVPA
jgi:hypothetical protein